MVCGRKSIGSAYKNALRMLLPNLSSSNLWTVACSHNDSISVVTDVYVEHFQRNKWMCVFVCDEGRLENSRGCNRKSEAFKI